MRHSKSLLSGEMQIKTGRDDRLTNVAIIRKTNNIASFGSGRRPKGLCVKKLGSRVALWEDCADSER